MVGALLGQGICFATLEVAAALFGQGKGGVPLFGQSRYGIGICKVKVIRALFG